MSALHKPKPAGALSMDNPRILSLGRLLILVLVCPLVTESRGAPAAQAWVQRYHGPGSADDTAQAIALGPGGEVYVSGSSAGTSAPFEYATVAYSSAGLPLWTNRYSRGEGTYNYARKVAADANSGNVYVTGQANSRITTIAYSSAGVALWTNHYVHPPSGGSPACLAVDASNGNVYVGGASPSMSAAYFTLAYSSTGTPLWTNHYRSPSYWVNSLVGMALDGHGHIYVTGFSWVTNAYYYATVAYSTAGLPLWTNLYNGGNGDDYAEGVAADDSHVYVTGESQGQGTRGDYVTIAYGTNGTPLWTNRYNGPDNGDDRPTGLAVSSSGHVSITGVSLNSSGDPEYATIAYSSAGTPLWTKRYNPGDLATSYAYGVAVDGRGNTIVSGGSGPVGGPHDYLTIAYSDTGVALWTNRYGGPTSGNDMALALAVGPDGAIYVTGISDGAHGSATNWDFATVKYIPAPDILFAEIKRLADSTYRLSLTAPTNVAYRLEASPDLKSWLPLTNFPPLPVTSLQYTDALAPSFPMRFYRTAWTP